MNKVKKPRTEHLSSQTFKLKHIKLHMASAREAQTVMISEFSNTAAPTVVTTHPITEAGEHYQAVGALQRAGVLNATLFEISHPSPNKGSWHKDSRFAVMPGIRQESDLLSPTMKAETGERVSLIEKEL